MGKVVSLAEYRQKKSEDELVKLREELEDLIGELEIVPEPYFVPVTSDYAFTGSMSYGTIPRYTPSVEDCVLDLHFISSILKSLGKYEASNDIDKIVDKLNTKE